MAAELEMETLTEGHGEIAEAGKRVSVHYEGRLEDGTVFDGSRPRGQAFSFTIGAGQVIRGWEQGVAGMKVGETRKLTIPPELGYGEAGAGGVIPPNATLVFEIELLEVTTPVVLGQATAEDLMKAQSEGVVVIDIRREEEWQETGIIDGAATVTAFAASGRVHPEFLDKFRELAPSPDTPVMLYCRTGNRTTSLGNALIDQLGFSDVSHLSAGIAGWMAEGRETVAYQD
ncbi:MAG: FKBP-type peptidyl-prolyl cis-trans isomerase [Pseudomonadota bacterium]|nr:FKBP-type peptidyl-prolyl cis-trans isomerase [Pseudomonadota bacterium]MEC8262628.1 FKBP-type peptidyl-prolyl cis-trans isomerase [Pseudomonadota bacterium]